MKNLQTEPKKVLCVGVVRQTQSAWFMYKQTINFFAEQSLTLKDERPLVKKVDLV